jgi:hypothetical protein
MPAHDPGAVAQPAASRADDRVRVPVRLAVAQTTVPEDPTDPGALRESGAQGSRHPQGRPRLWEVIHEGALRQMIGSPEIMRVQLDRLQAAHRRAVPNGPGAHS